MKPDSLRKIKSEQTSQEALKQEYAFIYGRNQNDKRRLEELDKLIDFEIDEKENNNTLDSSEK